LLHRRRQANRGCIAIAQYKARQWAEIERFKAGLKASLAEQGRANGMG
jgi:hypothetical protein